MLTIPPPAPGRTPRKVNLYEFLRGATCTLMPLFPYLDAGSIVPAGTLFTNAPGRQFGFFEHRNDVDEVFVCLASRGSRIPSGSVRVGPREHLVGGPFKDGADPDGFAVVLIVQRQAEHGPQRERVTFRCVGCREPLLSREFDASPVERDRQAELLGSHAPFQTLVDSLAVYRAYNASDRTCPGCGVVSPPFPIATWGTDRYVEATGAIREARAQHEAEARGT